MSVVEVSGCASQAGTLMFLTHAAKGHIGNSSYQLQPIPEVCRIGLWAIVAEYDGGQSKYWT